MSTFQAALAIDSYFFSFFQSANSVKASAGAPNYYWDCGAEYFHLTCSFGVKITDEKLHISSPDANIHVAMPPFNSTNISNLAAAANVMDSIEAFGLAVSCTLAENENCVAVLKTSLEPASVAKAPGNS